MTTKSWKVIYLPFLLHEDVWYQQVHRQVDHCGPYDLTLFPDGHKVSLPINHLRHQNVKSSRNILTLTSMSICSCEYSAESTVKTIRSSDSYTDLSGSSGRLIFAFQYLTKIYSGVHITPIKAKCRLPCFATYMPTLLFTGKIHVSCVQGALPTSGSYGTKPMKHCIRNFSCRPVSPQLCPLYSMSAEDQVPPCLAMGGW